VKRKRILIPTLAGLAVLSTVWLAANPPGRFGWCCYAFTTFSAWPRPVSDIQVRADGGIRKVAKTHQLTFEKIEWLLDPQPEVLIIALGGDGVTNPDDTIRNHKGCVVHLLKNRDAIELYNHLKKAGTRVAIHYHSTC
jgi:hypothetical protein